MTLGDGLSARTALDGLRAWAARDPERIAIADAKTALTFAAVLQRVEATSAVARAALSEARPGAYLPVVVDRSVDSGVAVLACLLGGVPFFPVDAKASPSLQRSLMARAGDSGLCLIGASEVDAIPGADTMRVTDDAGGADAPAMSPDSEEPIVIVFSSGSTGDPKGIILSRLAMEQRWRSRDVLAIPLGPERSEPLIPPLDSAWGLNLISDVASGFSVHIVDVASIGPSGFLARVAELQATAMAIPAQLARLLAQLPDRSVVPVPSMRRINIGSEAFRYEYLAGLRRFFGPDTRIHHNLASTEAGRELSNNFALRDAPAHGVIDLGQPVFPDVLRLVPVDGDDNFAELHVSGAIANEYLDDPDRTASRFYADPDGRRWWRSGDLLSIDSDGRYHHQGRIDDVVKVGGRLASPTDVSAVLLSVPGIRAAITVPVVNDGKTRLVSHVEVEHGSDVTLNAVREALSARLQPHAVPSAVMRHSHFPINARGKVDRKALPDGPFEPW